MPFETVKDAHPLSFRAGRFVLFDSQTALRRFASSRSIGGSHILIDVDDFRRGETPDPFAALVDHESGARIVDVQRHTVSERVARYAEGLAAATLDRPASRRSDRRRRRLDADFSIPISLSIGIQLPGGSR